jgi:hypothetical protein
MQEKGQQLETERAAKCHYEKPSLAAVRLFADQVLQTCGSDLCTPPPDLNKIS